jgi:uncharacterized protein
MKSCTAALAMAAFLAIPVPIDGVQESAQADVAQTARNLMIPMRDGVRLATDVYRPVVNGKPVDTKLPLLLQRTPYGKTGERLVAAAKFFARHGYVVVLQDERGTYDSEGVQFKYIGMGKDGYDTIEWLAKLPYVDGQVGMWGTSYAAHTQATAAILNPPHLKTIVLNQGGLANGWDHKIRNHGAFELAQQIGWAFGQLATQTNHPEARALVAAENVADWISVLPAKRGLNPLSIAPNFEDYIFDMMTHGDYDAYWKQPDVNWSLHYEQTSDIPMMHITGWYDSYAAGTIANYVGLSRIKKSPMRLIVGPWLHARNTQSHAGDVEFGREAAIADFNEQFHLRWFDHVLKRRDNGVAREAPAQIFVMGTGDGHKDANGRLFHGGAWRTVASWPLPDTRYASYYFHSDGSLTAAAPRSDDPPTAYTYDPHDPVPTIGGSFSSTAGLAAPGAFDQREREFTGDPNKGFLGSKPPYLPLKARPDVIVFQTTPLVEDVEVVGPITVKLFASSTAPDTDFTAKLIDVYPPSTDYPRGFEMNLTDGIVRARYRKSRETAEFMKPGEIHQFTIEPFPTANVFKKGHRIRVDISSSNFPKFDVNPNTGEPLGLNRRMQTATNTIYHDAAHPSAIVLPLVARTTTSDGADARQAGVDRRVTVTGLPLHYLEWGTPGRQPLILLHGIAREAHSFDHIAPAFARDYHVIAVDLRGHGDSGWHPDGAYLVEDHAKDLDGLVKALGLRRVVLLGNSTGGRVAQVYAGMHPENVAALIVEDVGPERPADIAAGFAKRVQQEANGWASEEELVAALKADNPGTSEALLRNHARYASKRRADGRVVWKRDPQLVKGFVPTDLWDHVRRISAPTIYILGGRSRIVDVETQRKLKATIPRCEIVVMPELGHYPHQEAPDEFITIVERFLSTLRNRRPS